MVYKDISSEHLGLWKGEDEMQQTVLVVEPNAIMRKVISTVLAVQYEVFTAAGGAEALQIFKETSIDLVLTAIDMPVYDGFWVCANIRKISSVPIIVQSAHKTQYDEKRAFELGVAAYLIVPFVINKLPAKVKEFLRRGNKKRVLNGEGGKFDIGVFSLDLDAHIARREGQEINLTPTEFVLLALFVRNAGKILTHRYILEAVWGPDYTEEREYLRAYVYNLRRKVEPNARSPKHILNIPGLGYQFDPAQAADPALSKV